MTTSVSESKNRAGTDQSTEDGAPAASIVEHESKGADRASPRIDKPGRPRVVAQSRSERAGKTKADIVLKKLRSAKGATIESLTEATGWQAHSVRGFLSATVRKKLGLPLVSEIGKDGVRRYRVETTAKAG